MAHFMTNLHESCVAGQGFKLMTPGLKSDNQSAAQLTALQSLAFHIDTVYVHVRYLDILSTETALQFSKVQYFTL